MANCGHMEPQDRKIREPYGAEHELWICKNSYPFSGFRSSSVCSLDPGTVQQHPCLLETKNLIDRILGCVDYAMHVPSVIAKTPHAIVGQFQISIFV